MKSLFLLPTDKPSMLWFNDLIDNNELILSLTEVETVNNQHLYITSDEEIKEGDWCINLAHKQVVKPTDVEWANSNHDNLKKIILTTDEDLIADGVQAIDDEFLEWFIKNPTCEFVEVEKRYSDFTVDPFVGYKIIIPQEESKQEGYICPHTKIQCDDECCVSAEDCHITSSLALGMVDCKEPKQETLEEAANRLFYTVGNEGISSIDSFMKGAEWQAKRKYSEEEVKQIIDATLIEHSDFVLADIPEWFEQFKKK